MLSAKSIFKLQNDFGVYKKDDTDFSKNDGISFEEYLSQCRTVISRQLTKEYYESSDEKKYKIMIQKINDYVNEHQINVKGYIENGRLNTHLLLEDVSAAISGESVLKKALEDESIDEIEILDYLTINVQRRGLWYPYLDEHGRRITFPSPQEVKMTILRLIDDGTGTVPQFTDGYPILNAKTKKDKYRVNAVHSSLNARGTGKYDFPIETISIRKFKKIKMSIEDIVKSGACSEDMAEFIKLIGRAGSMRCFCIGKTNSGKTTLLNSLAKEIPKSKKKIFIQNPTEVFMTERDEEGINLNRVIHWEVNSAAIDDDSETVGTMANLVSNSLRASPDAILPGECRTPKEFFQIYRACLTGHIVMSSFHSGSAKEAIFRMASEISKETKCSQKESLTDVANVIDFIITQTIYDSTGERKILGITEVCGTDENGNPLLNDIFEFKEDEVITDENGNRKMLGEFIQTGYITDKTKTNFIRGGISKKEIDKFVMPSDDAIRVS